MFVATINTPGYLPWDDDPPVFETAQEAWSYLADERRRAEDDAWDTYTSASAIEDTTTYAETVNQLDAYARAAHGPDVVYGPTPGYEGEHDLGLAYCVSVAEIEPTYEQEQLSKVSAGDHYRLKVESAVDSSATKWLDITPHQLELLYNILGSES